MPRQHSQRARLLFLNVGHFVDHLFMLIFAKAAFSAGLGFGLARDGAYAEMIPYGVPALILFGACAPIAAYLADKWNRTGMIAVFFIGVGLASIATSFATSPLGIGIGLAGIVPDFSSFLAEKICIQFSDNDLQNIVIATFCCGKV